MKIAIPVCGNRVSTVFAAADELLIIDNTPGASTKSSRVNWREDELLARTSQILESDAQVLLCGALSAALQHMLTASGVRVISFLRGSVDEIYDAFCSGNPIAARYYLPGCAPCRLPEPRRRHESVRRIKSQDDNKTNQHSYNHDGRSAESCRGEKEQDTEKQLP